MSLKRQKVGLLLDFDVHAAFCRLCELDGIGMAECAERLVVGFCERKHHEATVVHNALKDTEFARKLAESHGK